MSGIVHAFTAPAAAGAAATRAGAAAGVDAGDAPAGTVVDAALAGAGDGATVGEACDGVGVPDAVAGAGAGGRAGLAGAGEGAALAGTTGCAREVSGGPEPAVGAGSVCAASGAAQRSEMSVDRKTRVTANVGSGGGACG
jgi:hypothetical protein